MLTKLRTAIATALHTAKDRGASAVEYGLMVAAIAAVIVGIVFGLGTVVKNQFDKTSSCISSGGKTGATTGTGTGATTGTC